MKNTRFSNYRQLLRFKKPILNPKKRRLSRAHTIYDLRDIAKRVTPQGPFDYTDGAADQEISLNRARRAFEDIEFHPHILRNVDDASLATTLLGRPVNLPVGIAPTGFTRMMNSAGERASSSVAQELGIPFALSTMGTTSIENVAQAAPHGSNWFQLYLWRDREKSMQLISRAAAAALMV
jgi:isopentenyl diphosphate isomerase/L-lactate dehydrogenase-like FMN-dependent dehydrogenase